MHTRHHVFFTGKCSSDRPDGIIGFTPISNAVNLSQGIALYLTIYREIHGQGTKMNWPGTEKIWKCKHSDTSQGISARMEIYAATHVDRCRDGGIFSVADAETVTWEDVWAKLCADFGLIGEGQSRWNNLSNRILVCGRS